MFNRTNQVQTVNVNEWVAQLMAAHEDVLAVGRIRAELDKICAKYIENREQDLEKRQGLYDWYFEQMPYIDDFAKRVADIIDYRMPEPLVEHWQEVCEKYRSIKREKEQTDGQDER